MDKYNESQKRAMVMEQESIEKACGCFCQAVRNSEACCNGMRCRDKFTRTAGERVIRELRSAIWERRSESTPLQEVTNGDRKRNLLREIKNLVVLDCPEEDRDTKKIEYKINGTMVCKSFFKVHNTTYCRNLTLLV